MRFPAVEFLLFRLSKVIVLHVSGLQERIECSYRKYIVGACRGQANRGKEYYPC